MLDLVGVIKVEINGRVFYFNETYNNSLGDKKQNCVAESVCNIKDDEYVRIDIRDKKDEEDEEDMQASEKSVTEWLIELCK